MVETTCSLRFVSFSMFQSVQSACTTSTKFWNNFCFQAIIQERDDERDRLRRELLRSQEQVHSLLSQSSVRTSSLSATSPASRPASFISVEESSAADNTSEKNQESEDDGKFKATDIYKKQRLPKISTKIRDTWTGIQCRSKSMGSVVSLLHTRLQTYSGDLKSNSSKRTPSNYWAFFKILNVSDLEWLGLAIAKAMVQTIPNPNHSKYEQNGGHYVQTIWKLNTIWNPNAYGFQDPTVFYKPCE